jgi:hypothetical protein
LKNTPEEEEAENLAGNAKNSRKIQSKTVMRSEGVQIANYQRISL